MPDATELPFTIIRGGEPLTIRVRVDSGEEFDIRIVPSVFEVKLADRPATPDGVPPFEVKAALAVDVSRKK